MRARSGLFSCRRFFSSSFGFIGSPFFSQAAAEFDEFEDVFLFGFGQVGGEVGDLFDDWVFGGL